MRNVQCKKFRKYAKEFQKTYELYTEKQIYNMIKKQFNVIPRNLRSQYITDLFNNKIIIVAEQK